MNIRFRNQEDYEELKFSNIISIVIVAIGFMIITGIG